MRIYSCERNWEAMLTCIYEAWSSGAGQQNIKLKLEPFEEITLFDEYYHVDPDPAKADSVEDAVAKKISPAVLSELAYSAMSCDDDVLDNIYRVMILGFHFGPGVLDMLQYRDVERNREIRLRLGREQGYFREFIRFHEIRKSFFVAHIEPKSRLVAALGPHFMDRMPSEHWMIVDDVHKEAIVHPKDSGLFMRILTDEELEELLETEKVNDGYTDLWKVFFDSIAIKERENPRCQRNLMPLWTRKHAVEFL